MPTSLPFFFLNEKLISFRPFVCTDGRHPVHLASNHRCAGSNCQNMRSGLATDNTICGNVCLPVSHAPDWFMFSTLIFDTTKSMTPVKLLAPYNFRCHGRTGRQRYCNCTDCDPLVCVHTLDHNSTSALSACLFAAVPKSSFRLPVLCIPFVNCDLPMRFRAQVRQVVGLLSVLSRNVLHIIVDHPHKTGRFPPPPRVQCLLNGPSLRLALLSYRIMSIDSLCCNFAVSTFLYRGTLSAK